MKREDLIFDPHLIQKFLSAVHECICAAQFGSKQMHKCTRRFRVIFIPLKHPTELEEKKKQNSFQTRRRMFL